MRDDFNSLESLISDFDVLFADLNKRITLCSNKLRHAHVCELRTEALRLLNSINSLHSCIENVYGDASYGDVINDGD